MAKRSEIAEDDKRLVQETIGQDVPPEQSEDRVSQRPRESKAQEKAIKNDEQRSSKQVKKEHK